MSCDDILTSPQSVNLNINKLLPGTKGTSTDPAIAFTENLSTGWYLNDDNHIVLSIDGSESMVNTDSGIEFKQGIVLKDTSPDLCKCPQKGILYKKPGSSGLWWNTKDGEVNLLQHLESKTMMSNTVLSTPQITKQSISPDILSKLNELPEIKKSLDDIKKLSNSVDDLKKLTSIQDQSLSSGNTFKLYKPIELYDSVSSGLLYKKDNGLWWNINGKEVDITKQYFPKLNLPNGTGFAPTYSFSQNSNTGLYLIDSGNLGVSVNGGNKLQIKQSELVAQMPFRLQNGSNIQPSFSFQSSYQTGMYLEPPNRISFTVSGNKVLEIDEKYIKTNRVETNMVNADKIEVNELSAKNIIGLDKIISDVISNLNINTFADKPSITLTTSSTITNTDEIELKFKKMYDDLNIKNDTLYNKVSVIESKHSNLESKISIIDLLSNKYNDVISKYTDLNSKHTELSSKHTDLHSNQDKMLVIQNQLQSKQSELADRQSELLTNHNLLLNRVSGIETKIAGNINMSSNTTINTGVIDSKITSLDSKVYKAELKIKNIETRSITSDGRLSTLDGKFTTLDSKNAKTDTRITALESKTSMLESKSNSLETLIKTNTLPDSVIDNKLQPITSKLNECYTLLGNQASNLDSVKTNLDSVKSSIDSKLQEAQNMIETKINPLSKKIEEQMGNLEAVNKMFIDKSGEIDAKIDSKIVPIDKKFLVVDSKLITIDSKIVDVNSKLIDTSSKLTDTNSKITDISNKLPIIDNKMSQLERKVIDNLSAVSTEINDKLLTTNKLIDNTLFQINKSIKTESFTATQTITNTIESKIINTTDINSDNLIIKNNAIIGNIKSEDLASNKISSNEITTKKLSLPTSSKSDLSITFGNATGIYKDIYGAIGFSVNDIIALTIDDNALNANKPIRLSESKDSLPQYSFQSSKYTGLYYGNNTLSLTLNSNNISITNEKIALNGVVSLADNTKDDNAISYSKTLGKLHKKISDDGLYWNVNGKEYDLTASRFPLNAPSLNYGDELIPAYGFEEVGSGMSYDSKTSSLVLSSNTEKGISINDVVSLHKKLKIHAIDDSGQYTSDYGILYKKPNDNSLYWKTDNGEVVVSGGAMNNTAANSNSTPSLLSSSVVPSIAPLSDSDIPPPVPYDNVKCRINYEIKGYEAEIKELAGCDIKKGDILSFNNGLLYKAIGAKIIPIKELEYDALGINLFDYNSELYLLIIYIKNKIIINIIKKSDHSIIKKTDLEHKYDYSKVVNFAIVDDKNITFNLAIVYFNRDSDTVLITNNIVSSLVNENKVNENKVDTSIITDGTLSIVSNTRISTVTLPDKCSDITTEFDSSNSFIVIVGRTDIKQKIFISLIDFKTLTVGTTTSINQINDFTKELHLLIIPGGTYLISYGINKVVALATFYDSEVTIGETLIDYQSYDCIGMIYDNELSCIITIEKNISNSSFVQSIDILGTKIQKLSSKPLSLDIKPISFDYNYKTGNYIIMYNDASNYIKYTHLTFDGEVFNTGLRYFIKDSPKYKFNKKDKLIYWIPGTDSLISLYPLAAHIVIDGFNGNPNAFVGIATQPATKNDLCSFIPRGHIYDVLVNTSFVGKKLYLNNYELSVPECLTINSLNGVFIGTCISSNKILVGL
jgi:hypothetical protein